MRQEVKHGIISYHLCGTTGRKRHREQLQLIAESPPSRVSAFEAGHGMCTTEQWLLQRHITTA